MTTAVIILSVFAIIGWTLLLRVLYFYGCRPNRQGAGMKEHPPRPMTEQEKKLAAVHEAGHAIVACYSDRIPVSASIERTQLGLAATLFASPEQKNRTRESTREDIAILLAGRLAEELVLKETTSSCVHDLRNARFLARESIMTLGMGKRTGLVTYEDTPEQLMLLSERTRIDLEDDIRDAIEAGEGFARRIITDHLKEVESLANSLYDKGTLDGPAICKALGHDNAYFDKSPPVTR